MEELLRLFAEAEKNMAATKAVPQKLEQPCRSLQELIPKFEALVVEQSQRDAQLAEKKICLLETIISLCIVLKIKDFDYPANRQNSASIVINNGRKMLHTKAGEHGLDIYAEWLHYDYYSVSEGAFAAIVKRLSSDSELRKNRNKELEALFALLAASRPVLTEKK